MGEGLRGKRVFVTGGTGFIGSWLVRRLLKAGAEPHLLVRPGSSGARLSGLWGRIERHEGDIDEGASLASCVRICRPEIAFHLAKDRKDASFEKEAAATMRLAAILHGEAPGLKRWVRTALSVREAFGHGADAELCRAIIGRFALPLVTLELFQVYGPGQDAGDFPHSVMRGAGDLIQSRRKDSGSKDFVYVEDVARAYELAATRAGLEGDRFQIGSGELVDEGDVERLALRLMGVGERIPVAAQSGKRGHPADIKRSLQGLGWKPETSLEAGLSQMVKWLRAASPHGR